MTNTVNDLTLDDVTTLVSDFRSKFIPAEAAKDNDLLSQIKELTSKRDGLVYDMVAALVDLSIRLDVEAETGPYRKFLINKEIPLPSKSANPYGPFIKAIFAERVAGKWELPKEQRGRLKHANQIRFLVNAKRAGQITGTIQEFIQSYPDKLKGIEAQDRADNADGAAQQRIDDARSEGRKVAALYVIPDFAERKDGEVMKMWGVVRDGELAVVSIEVANDDAEGLFLRLGRKAAKK